MLTCFRSIPTVRFVGDEVAVVAAESEALAEDALRLIQVEYAVLPAVFDPEEALRPDAPLCTRRGTWSAAERWWSSVAMWRRG